MGLTEFAFSLFVWPILIFIAVFVFERAFGSRLIQLGLCTCLERVPWRDSRESRLSSSIAPEPSAVASTYQSTKKEALEKIESMLENFSMVLQKEDMVQRLPDTSGEEDEYDMVDIELGDTSQSNHDEQDETKSIDNNNEKETNSTTTDNIAELFRYTHIKIPYAGQKIEEDTDDHNNNPNSRREVPHFCAICLGQYELDDAVSWASNSQCTHCFHRDCVTQWWIASWKKKRRRTVLHTPEEKATINCPMCRQSFMCWLEESCGASSKEKESSSDETTQRRIDEELADY